MSHNISFTTLHTEERRFARSSVCNVVKVRNNNTLLMHYLILLSSNQTPKTTPAKRAITNANANAGIVKVIILIFFMILEKL